MSCEPELPSLERNYLSPDIMLLYFFFFFSSRRRHTRFKCDWSSDVCSSDLSPNYARFGECPVSHRGPDVRVLGKYALRGRTFLKACSTRLRSALVRAHL